MQRTFRTAATAVGAAGLVAAGLLAGPAMAANASQASAPSPAARLPISARQLQADQQLHKRAADASGAITGSALAADGQPLNDVCVSAYGPAGKSFASTRPDGRFLLSGLKPGIYQVRYAGCGSTAQYLPQWYGGTAERNASSSVLVRASALRPLAPVTMRTPAGQSVTADVINPASQATIVQSLRTALGMPAYGTGTDQAAPAVVAAAKRGSISGVVTNPSGHGLKGICVEALSENGSGFGYTTTGKTGHYRAGSLPAGSYVVFFIPECGNTGNWIAQVYKDAAFTKPTLVHVHRGKTTTGVNAQLKLGGEISGTVTNRRGAKLSAICVEPAGTGTNYAALFVSGLAEHGTYHLRGLPAGTYRLVFAPCGPSSSAYAAIWWQHAESERSAKAIHLKSRQVLSHINAIMPIGGVISGTVTNSSNAPLKDICVNAVPSGSGSSGETGFFVSVGTGLSQEPITNAAGKYKITGLPAGSYQVQFSLGCGNNGNYVSANYPSLVKVKYGQTRAGISVQLPTGATLSGTVTSATSGKPIKGICADIESGANSNYYAPDVATSAAGTYKFEQMPAGTYYVGFSGGCGNPGSYAPQGYDNTNPFLPQAIKVTAAGQVITGIDAAMQPGATITGTVEGQHGQKLTGMCVYADSNAFESSGEVSSHEGRYSIPDLEPGQYQVYFGPGCNSNANLATVSFGSQLNPSEISAPAGTTSGIDGVLPAAGNISGKVLTKAGKAFEEGCVEVTGLNAATEADSGYGGGPNSSSGKYEMTGLLPGPYDVVFQPDCYSTSSYENQWYKDKPSPAGAVRVQVRAGRTTTGISSALVSGGSIAGKVTSAGKPIRNACVFAQSITQLADYGNGVTNKAGKYVVPGLNSGKYELEFYPCGEGSTTLAERVLTRVIQVTAPRRTNGINATLALAGKISGTVLGGSPAVAQPEECVDAYQVNGYGINEGFSGANGKFTISNLLAGKYLVYVGDTNCGLDISNLAPQWYPNEPTSAHATEVTVASGKVTALATVTLSTNGGISGSVTGPGAAAVAGICVTATSGLSPVPVVAVTGATGTYSLIGLAPATYRVEFSSGCGASGYKTQWWDAKNSAGKATPVAVTAATTKTDINAALQK